MRERGIRKQKAGFLSSGSEKVKGKRERGDGEQEEKERGRVGTAWATSHPLVRQMTLRQRGDWQPNNDNRNHTWWKRDQRKRRCELKERRKDQWRGRVSCECESMRGERICGLRRTLTQQGRAAGRLWWSTVCVLHWWGKTICGWNRKTLLITTVDKWNREIIQARGI